MRLRRLGWRRRGRCWRWVVAESLTEIVEPGWALWPGSPLSTPVMRRVKAGRLADAITEIHIGQVRYVLPPDWDGRTDRQDGEWREVVTLAHEEVEHEGHVVPAFEGDVERREWEERHG